MRVLQLCVISLVMIVCALPLYAGDETDRNATESGSGVVETLQVLNERDVTCEYAKVAANPEAQAIRNIVNGIRPGDDTDALEMALGEPEITAKDIQVGSTPKLSLRKYEIPLEADRGVHTLSTYLDGDRYVFGIFAPGDSDDPFPRAPAQWRAKMGDPEAELSSFHGQNAQLWLYPAAGIGLHVENDRVITVELFEPTQLDDYVAAFYRAPAPR